MRKSTAETYSNELTAIKRFCELMHRRAVPAEGRTVRLYSSICNNASTLRGHLAAWKFAHKVQELPWPTQGDEILQAVHTGVFSLQPPRPEKKRMRRRLLKQILAVAAKRKDTEFGYSLIMLYTYLLRGPSEWWDQAESHKVQYRSGYLCYGPLTRKQRKCQVTLYRQCVCQGHRLLCAHLWHEAWEQERPRHSGYLTSSVDKFTRKLRGYIRELYPQMPEDEILTWTTHSCRRGAAADILHRQGLTDDGGLDAMLRMADWSGPKGAHPYTSADEIEGAAMGDLLIDNLD